MSRQDDLAEEMITGNDIVSLRRDVATEIGTLRRDLTEAVSNKASLASVGQLSVEVEILKRLADRVVRIERWCSGAEDKIEAPDPADADLPQPPPPYGDYDRTGSIRPIDETPEHEKRTFNVPVAPPGPCVHVWSVGQKKTDGGSWQPTDLLCTKCGWNPKISVQPV